MYEFKVFDRATQEKLKRLKFPGLPGIGNTHRIPSARERLLKKIIPQIGKKG